MTRSSLYTRRFGRINLVLLVTDQLKMALWARKGFLAVGETDKKQLENGFLWIFLWLLMNDRRILTEYDHCGHRDPSCCSICSCAVVLSSISPTNVFNSQLTWLPQISLFTNFAPREVKTGHFCSICCSAIDEKRFSLCEIGGFWPNNDYACCLKRKQ